MKTVRYYEGIHEQFRLEPIPGDWLVFNTSRPIFGTLDADMVAKIDALDPGFGPDILGGKRRVGVTWVNPGVGRLGWFFSAVNPEDPDREDLLRRINSLDGHLCVWVTQTEVDEALKRYYAINYPRHDIDLDKYELFSKVNSYENIARDLGIDKLKQ